LGRFSLRLPFGLLFQFGPLGSQLLLVFLYPGRRLFQTAGALLQAAALPLEIGAGGLDGAFQLVPVLLKPGVACQLLIPSGLGLAGLLPCLVALFDLLPRRQDGLIIGQALTVLLDLGGDAF